MASITLRGLDDQALAQLKRQAQQEGSSLNSLVLRLLQAGSKPTSAGGLKTFTDLDALAGTWGTEDVETFEQALRPVTLRASTAGS